MTRGLALAVAVLALSGCRLDRVAVDQMTPVFANTKDDFNRLTVVSYAREAGPGLLATLNGMVRSSPNNVELRLIQAELNATFAFGFLETSDPAWADYHYDVARAAALAALHRVDTDLAGQLETLAEEPLRARLKETSTAALPPLFWWGFARGSQINLHRSDPGAVADLARVDAVMEWVLEHDETFFYAGPHLYFAMRHFALPETLGGDPAEGLRHYERVEALTEGRHLLAKVIWAQFYAPGLAATPAGAPIKAVLAAQKRAWDGFYTALTEVIAAPDDLWPERALVNAIAKERARKLLADPEANNIIRPRASRTPTAPAAG